jgi:hypothetical protein
VPFTAVPSDAAVPRKRRGKPSKQNAASKLNAALKVKEGPGSSVANKVAEEQEEEAQILLSHERNALARDWYFGLVRISLLHAQSPSLSITQCIVACLLEPKDADA